MLCCSLLLDMACHTTWYWHLFFALPLSLLQVGLRLRPRDDPKKRVKCWSLRLLNQWTIPHHSDLSWLQLKGPINKILTASQSKRPSYICKRSLGDFGVWWFGHEWLNSSYTKRHFCMSILYRSKLLYFRTKGPLHALLRLTMFLHLPNVFEEL